MYVCVGKGVSMVHKGRSHTVYTNTQHGVKTNLKLKSWIVLLQEYIIFIFIYIYIHIYIHTYINIYIYSLDFLHCMKFTGMHEFMHYMVFSFFFSFSLVFAIPPWWFLEEWVIWAAWSYVQVTLTSTGSRLNQSARKCSQPSSVISSPPPVTVFSWFVFSA